MKTITKLVSIALSMTLATSLLVGCKKTENAGTQSPVTNNEKITLSFRSYYGDMTNSYYKLYSDMVKEWNDKNPNIEIKYEAISPEVNKQKANVEIAGGDIPDIMLMTRDQIALQYSDAGRLADLTPYLKDTAWGKSFMPGSIRKIGGKYISVPSNGFTEALYYNKDIFKKNNIAVPKTIDDLFTVIDKLNAKNIVPIAMGDKQTWNAPFLFQYLMERAAGNDAFSKALKGEIKFNNPDYVKASETFIKIVEKGGFNKGAAMADSEEAATLFRNEKAAMTVDGSWALGKYMDKANAAPNFGSKVGIIPFPTYSDGKGDGNAYFGGYDTGAVVSSRLKGKNLEAAIKFLKFTTSQEFISKVLYNTGNLVPVKLTNVDQSKISPPLKATLDYTNKASKSLTVYDYYLNESENKAWTDYVQSLLAGNKDIKKGLDSIDAAVKASK